MAKKTYETGHAKNVANFLTLIDFLEGYGADYNPANASLELTNLQKLLQSGQKAIADVISANEQENVAINARREAYSSLKPYSLRLLNALISSSQASVQTINDAKGFRRKIIGVRAKDLKNETLAEGTDPQNHISVAQLSFTNLAEHMEGLNEVLINEVTYSTNVQDLKTATVTAYIKTLKQSNNAASKASVNASNKRITRNNVLYKADTGIFDIVKKVKAEVRSVFGTGSPQDKQVTAIKFYDRVDD